MAEQQEEQQDAEQSAQGIFFFEWTDEIEENARKVLESDDKTVPPFWYDKYEKEAQKNWDIFYKRHTTNFFKDRHYLDREFQELSADGVLDDVKPENTDKKILIEVGCGVGNTVFPLLELNPNLFVFALDFSPRAIEFVKAHPSYNTERCSAYVVDITKDPFPQQIVDTGGVDFVMMMFVLSAVAPEKMDLAISKIFDILKPGGCVLFRDYGLYDLAQLRLAQHHRSKLKDNFYVRADGTRAYYFSMENLSELFTRAGFEVIENKYHRRQITNRKLEQVMHRVWIQGKFRKPGPQEAVPVDA
eukprot:GILK01005569.1.p1 GENE.GILK01005569.1~~GILK01005569.1.p1  ORF type:complete len:316 (+),score=56.90 GILK01005569.1:43-948(+)